MGQKFRSSPSSATSEATQLFIWRRWKWAEPDKRAGLALCTIVRPGAISCAKLARSGAAPSLPWSARDKKISRAEREQTIPPGLCPLNKSSLSHMNPPWSQQFRQAAHSPGSLSPSQFYPRVLRYYLYYFVSKPKRKTFAGFLSDGLYYYSYFLNQFCCQLATLLTWEFWQ